MRDQLSTNGSEATRRSLPDDRGLLLRSETDFLIVVAPFFSSSNHRLRVRSRGKQRMTKHLYLGIGITAGLTAGLVMLVVVGFRQRGRFVAHYLVSRTAKMSDRDLTSHLRRLALLGPEGMPGLVDSLASGRPAERDAARVVLEEVVARECGTNTESQCLQRLTRALATAADSLSERSREAALRWTSRIVVEQYRSGRRDPTVLAYCRRIQEAWPSVSSSVPFLASSDSERPARAMQSEERTVADARNRMNDFGAPRGQNVFAQSSQDPASVDPVEKSSEAAEKSPSPEEPARLPALADAGLDTIPEPAEVPNNSVEVANPDNAILNADFGVSVDEHLAKSEGPGPSVPATSVSSESPTTSATLQAELRRRPDGLSDRDLLTLLYHDDAEVSGWAENELRRRDISPEEVALGRLIAHPDSGVRQRLARGLPKMPKVDHVVWLLELSHDSHPAVRLATLRSMAEFDDAKLEARADEMVDQDPNESVRQRALWQQRVRWLNSTTRSSKRGRTKWLIRGPTNPFASDLDGWRAPHLRR